MFFSNKGFPKGGDGGGGSAIWEKFPNNTVIFFWERTWGILVIVVRDETQLRCVDM